MTTGERIKEARLSAHLTQKHLAERVGVKFSAIHKYETGIVVNLKRETIDALAKALNVKPSWLLCLDDEESHEYKYYFYLQLNSDAELYRFKCYVREKSNNFYKTSEITDDRLTMDEVRLIFAWREADEKSRRKIAIELEDYGFSYAPDK